jgi:hypothetical protein
VLLLCCQCVANVWLMCCYCVTNVLLTRMAAGAKAKAREAHAGKIAMWCEDFRQHLTGLSLAEVLEEERKGEGGGGWGAVPRSFIFSRCVACPELNGRYVLGINSKIKNKNKKVNFLVKVLLSIHYVLTFQNFYLAASQECPESDQANNINRPIYVKEVAAERGEDAGGEGALGEAGAVVGIGVGVGVARDGSVCGTHSEKSSAQQLYIVHMLGH